MMLPLTPLTAEAFAPFGALLSYDPSRSRAVNEGRAWRSELRGMDDRAPDAFPALAIYRLQAQCLPLAVDLFERHPHSTQCFAALTVERFIVVVAPSRPDGLPDPAGAEAFLGTRGLCVRYRRDQWHAPMVALDTGGDMLMLAWERGKPNDCIEHRLPSSLVVTP